MAAEPEKSCGGRPLRKLVTWSRDSVLCGPRACISAAFPQSMFFTLHLYRGWLHCRFISGFKVSLLLFFGGT